MNAPSFIKARRAAAGFTLVEMVITLTVFVLLSGMILSIVTGVLRSAGSLQDNQNRGDQADALQAYLKNQFIDLPSQSILVTYRRGDGEGLAQNGIILGTDNVRTAIDAKIQANGLYTLRVATVSAGGDLTKAAAFNNNVANNENALAWTPLIGDVQSVSWKFQDSNVLKWVDAWNGLSSRPALIELSIQLAGDLRPTVMDFWLPHLVAPPTFTPAVTSTAAPPATSHAP
jgi:prepilin-type N-terminal cleavage/methylation domain-containing protein